MKNGVIGCSPDGIIFDSSEGEGRQKGLLEIKCPFSVKDTRQLTECAMAKNCPCSIMPDKTLQLKKEQNYFFQVQGGMAVTNTQWCDFVVWTPQWISVQRIPYDEEWTTSMLAKLMVFYQSALFPQLLQVKPVSHPVCASTPTAACCSGCAYSGLVLRTCMRCQHTFHHLCTSDDEGKVCKCCKG